MSDCPDDTRPSLRLETGSAPSDAAEPGCKDCDDSTQCAWARAAIEARDAFIGAVVHELRSPMAPICGQIELLQHAALRDGASPTIILAVAKLRASVDHYMRRSAMLIETTRIASGRRRLQPEDLNLSELVGAVVDNYQAIAARKRTLLRADIEAGLIGHWDSVGMEQIVDNLVSNALKYGGGLPVQVSLARKAGRVRLMVSDCGPGILPEDQQAIFAPFEQMARGAARRGGFGIGLWVVRQLIEAMAGTITLDTAPGRGATFIVTLPINPPRG